MSKMSKLQTTLVMGVSAIMFCASYNVYANTPEIYRCAKANGSVVFQDFACNSVITPKKIEAEAIIVNGTKEPGPTLGLREDEKMLLQRYDTNHQQQQWRKMLIKISNQ